MQSASGEKVDLYIPRKCSWTNRLIAAKDHASVQINVADIDPTTGKYEGDYQTYALCGFIRAKGEADLALTELVAKADSA
ncbi:RPS21 [Symbiodinium sp. KB8]|nr:RPS21 [Symbiodinium sp. KB8]